MKTNIIYNEDCIKGIKKLPNKSVNLIIADPPYNIGKADWDKIPDYINWTGKWITECQRVLKDNGSFYWFHNDFLQIVEIQNWINKNSKFIFKQFIVWNKRYEGSSRKWYFDNVIQSSIDRNYRLIAEYLLFYTFQGKTGLNVIKSNKNLFESIKQYLRNEKNKSRMTLTDFNELLVNKRQSDCIAKRYFGDSQWELPTKKMYVKLQATGYFQKPYEDLRREYEDLRYTFNNQKTHHSVWNYEIAEKNGHITPKPIPLIENILKHSSNENDIVLIPFVGSSNDCIACKRMERYYIGFEINKEYCKIAKARLEAEKTLWDMKSE